MDDYRLAHPDIDYWLEANQGDDVLLQIRGDGTLAIVKDNEEREVIARFNATGYLIPLDDCFPPINESNEECMNFFESECEVAQAPNYIDESGNEVYDDGIYMHEHDGIYSFSFNPISINEDHVELPSCELDTSHEKMDIESLECDLKDINLDSSIQVPLDTPFIHPFQKIPHSRLDLHASQIVIDYFSKENNALLDSTSLMIESSNEEHFSETLMDYIDTFIRHTDKYDDTSMLLSAYSLVKSTSTLDLITWEDKFRKVKVDPLRLKNAEDEFERLIFNPGISSLPQNINVKSNQRNDNVTILYDLITSFHDDLDIFGDTLIEDSGNPFDTVVDSYCVFSDKFVKAPYKGDVIDFIIPIFHPHMNSTLLLKHANYFPFLYLMLGWKHVRQKKKNRLGDYPYWKMFGSMEFMPTSSRVTFFLLRIESSNNT